MREVLHVAGVLATATNFFTRYSWPVEFVRARAQGHRLDRFLGRTTR